MHTSRERCRPTTPDAPRESKLPANNAILYNIQTVFNLLPNMNIEAFVRAMFSKTNDFYMVIYLSALIRSVIALHNLVNNKIKYKDGADGKDKDSEKAKDKAKDKGEDKAKDKGKGNEKDAAKGGGNKAEKKK